MNLRAFISITSVVALLASCGAPAAPKGPSDPNATVTSTPHVESAKGVAAPAYPGPVPVYADDPVRGNTNAWVTIVQFSDFQCPFCSRVEPTLARIEREYGPDNVRIVWKNLPLAFHEHARPAAQVGSGVFATAGNDAFWRFHRIVFENQKDLSDDALVRFAAAAGAKDQIIQDGLHNHTWETRVARDEALAKELGVSGTPGFMINGVSLSGAQPFEKFKDVIDTELARAKELASKGTPRDSIYVSASVANYKKPTREAANDRDDDDKEDTKTVFNVPVGNSPALGNPNALVTIVEFSDFQCPFCKRVEPTLKKVRDVYGEKVRFVWKDEPLPFHPRAVPAAEFAREARAQKGDIGFWEAHDKLFEIQPRLEDAELETAARDLNLNVEKVRSAIKSRKYKSVIDADHDLADDVQASGTPHFFINGRRLVGAQPFEKFKTIIDEEITKGYAVVAKGIAPKDLYAELIKNGQRAPEPEKKVVALSPRSPSRGPANAKVVIQEFSDFQCPFCSRVEPTIAEIMKNYGTNVRFVWRDKPLPMHPDAPLAAQAAREAKAQQGDAGFWKMHDKLFDAQKKEAGLKREALDGYAKELGLNMAKWKVALDTGTHAEAIEADAKAGDDAGISGTPAFLINGYFISGAQPYPKFKKVIERALKEAK